MLLRGDLRNKKMNILNKWLFATPKEKIKLGNPFLQMFAQCASEDVKVPDGFEDPQDRANELETESYLETKNEQERMEAKEEKLEAKMWEDTEQANEEYMELREQEKVDYGPDDRHAN